MATTRSKESNFGYTGKKGQDASAINWPLVNKKPEANYSLSDFGEYHWVVYEGGLELLNDKESESDYDEITDIEFNVVTWGQFKNDNLDEAEKIKISKKQYIANYYGYLKFKK